MSPGECFGIIIAPQHFRVKKATKKKKGGGGSVTVYTKYIEQKLVTCTCTRPIFTRMNMYALRKVCKLLFNIHRYHSVSEFATKSYSQHLHVIKIYLSVQILSYELGKRSTVLGTIPETTKQEVQIKS